MDRLVQKQFFYLRYNHHKFPLQTHRKEKTKRFEQQTRHLDALMTKIIRPIKNRCTNLGWRQEQQYLELVLFFEQKLLAPMVLSIETFLELKRIDVEELQLKLEFEIDFA